MRQDDRGRGIPAWHPTSPEVCGFNNKRTCVSTKAKVSRILQSYGHIVVVLGKWVELTQCHLSTSLENKMYPQRKSPEKGPTDQVLAPLMSLNIGLGGEFVADGKKK